MTDEQLADMRRRLAESTERHYAEDWLIEPSDVEDLLAEVDRLRAREAAMREVMEAVAKEDALWYDEYAKHCAFCDNALDPRIRDRIYHTADCPVTKARALLDKQE